MKKYLVLTVFIILYSCSLHIEKKLYSKGFYIQNNSVTYIKKQNLEKLSSLEIIENQTENTDTIISLNEQNTIEVTNNETLTTCNKNDYNFTEEINKDK